MFPLSQLILDGLFTSLVFTVIVGLVVWRYPRLLLQDFPKDIQSLVPPKTEREQRISMVLFVLVLVVFMGLPLVLTLQAAGSSELTFWTAYAYAYGIFLIVNLWDLVVLDWLGMTLFVDPQKPPFPGTEGAAGWRDYAFHFRGFLKGNVIGLVMMLPVAALAVVAF